MAWSFPLSSVLLPFDFSPESRAAVEVARSLVARDEDVHILYVAGIPAAADPAAIWGHIDLDTLRRNAERELGVAIEASGRALTGTVRIGDPAHEIVEYANSESIPLIVIPSHGRRGLRRLLLGSVAERVLRLSTKPVFVLKPEPEA